MLIYSNGNQLKQSTVYELKLPQTFSLNANQNNESQVVWKFTHEDLHLEKKFLEQQDSQMEIQLITEGDYGIWEVTSEGEIVWQFNADGFFWRTYNYDKNSPEIKLLGL